MPWFIFALFDANMLKKTTMSVFIIDVIYNLILLWIASSSTTSTSESDSNSNKNNSMNFHLDFNHGNCLDLLLLSGIRVVLFSCLSALAVWWWKRMMKGAKLQIIASESSNDNTNSQPNLASDSDQDQQIQLQQNLNLSSLSTTVVTQVIQEVDSDAEIVQEPVTTVVEGQKIVQSEESEINQQDPLLSSTRAAIEELSEQTKTSDIDDKTNYINLAKAADLRKTVITYMIFTLAFFMSVYIGVKTVVYDDGIKSSLIYDNDDIDANIANDLRNHNVNDNFFSPHSDFIAKLIGFGVFLVNFEFMCLRELIESLTKEEGELIPSLHIHPLFFEVGLQCHTCDICHERTKKPHFEAYRCRTCDFDLCIRCHKRKDNADFKGIAFRRGNKSSGSGLNLNLAICPTVPEDNEAKVKSSGTGTVSAAAAAVSSTQQQTTASSSSSTTTNATPQTTAANPTTNNNSKDGNPDSTEQQQQSLTTWGYFHKCIQMCLEFWPTLAMATSSLILSQILTLISPHLQGQIFDALIGRIGPKPGPSIETDRFDTGLSTNLNHTIHLNLPFDYTKFDTYTTLLNPVHIITVGTPYYYNNIIFSGPISGSESQLYGPGPDIEKFHSVMRLYVIINVLSGLFNGLRSLGIELSMRNLAAIVRRRLFYSIIQIDIGVFDGLHTGQLTSRLTNDASAMVSPMSTLMNDLVSNLILLFGGTFFAFYTSWKLSILSICVVPPISFMYRRYAKWARTINRAIWSAYGDCNAVATEAIGNVRTVRAFSAEDYEIGRFDAGVGVALSHGVRNSFVGASVQAFSSYMNLLTATLILWYGGYSVIQGSMKIGDLVSFQLYWNLLNSSFLQLGNVFNQLIRASSAAERVFQIIDMEHSGSSGCVKTPMPGLRNSRGVLNFSGQSAAGGSGESGSGSSSVRVVTGTPLLDPTEISEIGSESQSQSQNQNQQNLIPLPTTQGYITIEDVHFTYVTRPENPVLKGINLTLKPNTITALVGKSGGGKSTLIHLLLRFYEPNEGRLTIDNMPLQSVNPHDYRKHIGLVSQETQLFATSILENLLYGLDNRESITTKEVIEACQLANAHEFIMKFEEKYETRCGEKGTMLSGGQKQRLALARCFLRKPKILLLDEATSALDTENEQLVQSGIDRLLERSKCTVLLIAHRLSTVMNADQIAVISDGIIKELGTHDELVRIGEQNGGIYAKLVSRQMKRDENVIDEKKIEDGGGGKKDGKKGGGGGGGGKGSGKGTEIDALFDE